MAAACGGSLLVSLIAFVLLNLIPIWIMIAILGRDDVEASPGGGAGILFMTVPVTGMLAAVLFCALTAYFYQRLEDRTT